MANFTIYQYALPLLLSLGCIPSLLHAQQLQQPESVLPWSATQPKVTLALRPPVSARLDDSPAWLVGSVQNRAETPPKSSGLHMVETEPFVDLGPLEAEPIPKTTSSAFRQRTSRSTLSRPLSFFKALGIQANRPQNRN